MAVGRINSGIGFSDFSPSAHRGMTGGVGAAGQSTVADNFSTLERNKPDYDGINQSGQARESALKRKTIEINTGVRDSALQAKQVVSQAEKDADAIRSEASANSSTSTFNSMLSAGVKLAGSAMLFSDEEMKENIERIDDALSTLRQLKPVTYNYKEEYSADFNRMHHGFIAQDYEKVLPDATYHDPTVDKLCIDTGDLIGLLVRAVQQLETKVTRLEAKLVLEGVK